MPFSHVAMCVAVIGEIGIALLTVTTNLSSNSMRKSLANAALIGEARLLKVRRSLAVGEVGLCSEGSDGPFAHVVGTYAIPAVSISPCE